MITCMMSKALLPHDIIRVEMRAAPIIIEALFQSVSCIQRLWEGSLNEGTHGWHLCHQNNLISMETFVVGMLKSSNGPHLNMPKVEEKHECIIPFPM